MGTKLFRLFWYLYDFGNSSYSAVIAGTIFPVYFATYIVGTENNLGDALWGKAISISMFFCALLSPYAGGIADLLGARKKMLFVFTALCVLSVSSFSLLKKGMLIEGFLLVILANFSMEMAFVFYNSFIVFIEKDYGFGKISAIGFAAGYLGSVISLLMSLFLLERGLTNLIWPFCGAFFFLFSIPLIVTLPPERSIKTGVMSAAKKGLDELLKLVRKVLKDRNLKYFLLAYLFYEDAINTVIVFSSIYASFTFGFGQAEIVQLYLSTQLSAMLGAFIIARFIESIGYKRTLSLSLVAWIIITITAAISSEKWQFGLACLTGGFFLGILQASSRALFATFIPKVEVSKYFGLYSLVGKSSSIIGPASFGAISYLTGSQRIAAIFVSTLFIFGLIVLGKVKEKSC